MKPTIPSQQPKDYYSLTELLTQGLVPLKSKQLHVRFKKLVNEEILVYGENLYREGSSWQIHKSAIPLFEYKAIMKLKKQDLPYTKG
jgi:hypothetical protein